jgi:hypothetical protein
MHLEGLVEQACRHLPGRGVGTRTVRPMERLVLLRQSTPSRFYA